MNGLLEDNFFVVPKDDKKITLEFQEIAMRDGLWQTHEIYVIE